MTISKRNFARLIAFAAKRLIATFSSGEAANGKNDSRLSTKIEPLDGFPNRVVPSAAVHSAIIEVLDNLPARARLIFLMSRVDRLSYSEIALRLGVSRRAVHRAMELAIAAVARAVPVEESEDSDRT